MNFRLECELRRWKETIRHTEALLLVGSCFTEQMGAKLDHYKFSTLQNPNGILFNPVSIARSVSRYISGEPYVAEDLFVHQDIWGSWDHHTRYSAVSRQDCLAGINASLAKAHGFLSRSDWMIVTLGSSFVYRLSDGRVVANCHKVPASSFTRELLDAGQVIACLSAMIEELRAFRPALRILFTISPVRHVRDGFVENNRSKAHLITAVHHLVSAYSGVHYFPAYELIIDELRDYRFFAEDMVHPNYQATQYVWERFCETCLQEDVQKIMEELSEVLAARSHRSLHPESEVHRRFLAKYLDKAVALQQRYPYLDLSEVIAYFGS